jgi:inosine/xanthosine triphosphate pyrophosphatase family protein
MNSFIRMLDGFTDRSAVAVCSIAVATETGEILVFQGKTEVILYFFMII